MRAAGGADEREAEAKRAEAEKETGKDFDDTPF